VIDLPPLDPGIEITVASRGISKGIAQTEGPQMVLRPYVQMGLVQVGAQWKNLSSAVAGGEAAPFVTVSPKLGKFQLSLGAAYKFQTGVTEPTDDKSWEFTGAVSRKFGNLAVRVSAIYSPDDLGGAKQSVYIDGSATLDFAKCWRVGAGVGRRERENGDDYTSFFTGVGKTLFKGVNVDARYYATNRSDLGDFYEDRIVVIGRVAI
jgi:uncharacterized protein Gcw-chp